MGGWGGGGGHSQQGDPDPNWKAPERSLGCTRRDQAPGQSEPVERAAWSGRVNRQHPGFKDTSMGNTHG